MSDDISQPIGILGGTFDPPHLGHLSLAQAAMRAAGLDRVILIPTHDPPHKTRPDMAPAHHRLAMARILAMAADRLSVDDREIARGGKSYTIDTLRSIAVEHPYWRLRLIMGADMAVTFHTWREPEEILRLAPPLIAERPGVALRTDWPLADISGISAAGCRLLQEGRFAMPPCPISSSTIRSALRRGEDVSAFLLPSVLAYIRANRLYADD